MRLRKAPAATVEPVVAKPTRNVTFTLPFGEQETLKSVQAALTQARCVGVPDDATVRILGGSYLGGGREFTAYFSWSEPVL